MCRSANIHYYSPRSENAETFWIFLCNFPTTVFLHLAVAVAETATIGRY